MPRKNKNALGKPQGVKKKVVHHPEQSEYKQVIVPMSVKSRLDTATVKALYEVFG